MADINKIFVHVPGGSVASFLNTYGPHAANRDQSYDNKIVFLEGHPEITIGDKTYPQVPNRIFTHGDVYGLDEIQVNNFIKSWVEANLDSNVNAKTDADGGVYALKSLVQTDGTITGEYTNALATKAALDKAVEDLTAAITAAASGVNVVGDNTHIEVTKDVTKNEFTVKAVDVVSKTAYDSKVQALETADSNNAAAIATEKTRAEGVEGTIIASVGLGADGAAASFADTNYAKSASTVAAAVKAVDAQVKANADAVSSESERAQQKEAELSTSIATAQSNAEKNAKDYTDTSIQNVAFGTKTQDGKKYLVLYSDESKATEIASIPEEDFVIDGILDNVTLDGDDLIFTFNDASGKSQITIDLNKFIDVYTAGAGIMLNGREIAVKLDASGADNDNAEYLTVSAAGVKLHGITNAIEAAEAAAKSVVVDGGTSSYVTVTGQVQNDGHTIYTVGLAADVDDSNADLSLASYNALETAVKDLKQEIATAAGATHINGSENITVNYSSADGVNTYTISAKDLVTTETYNAAYASLNQAIATNASSIADEKTRAENIEGNIIASVGLGENGAAASFVDTNYAKSASTVAAAVKAVDTQVKANADNIVLAKTVVTASNPSSTYYSITNEGGGNIADNYVVSLNVDAANGLASVSYCELTAKNEAINAVNAFKTSLKADDTEVTGQYVSAVSQTDGKITVTRKDLPKIVDGGFTSTNSYISGDVLVSNDDTTGDHTISVSVTLDENAVKTYVLSDLWETFQPGA